MSTWAVVPVKARREGKQRLSPVLAPAPRALLVARMLEQVIDAARSSGAIEEILVISPELSGLPAGVRTYRDAGAGLNVALSAALPLLQEAGVRCAVVLAADLPALSGADVAALAGVGERIALAPDRAGTGTNAIALPLGTGFNFQFGADSLARHRAEARRLGLSALLIEREGLAFDVDEPADLERLRALGAARYGELGSGTS